MEGALETGRVDSSEQPRGLVTVEAKLDGGRIRAGNHEVSRWGKADLDAGIQHLLDFHRAQAKVSPGFQ
jgi:hypothetical protein